MLCNATVERILAKRGDAYVCMCVCVHGSNNRAGEWDRSAVNRIEIKTKSKT